MNGTRQSAQAETDSTDFYQEAKEVAKELDDFLVEQMAERPYVALGAAAAIGYALGLPRGALALLTGLGSRMAWGWVESLFLEPPSAGSGPR